MAKHQHNNIVNQLVEDPTFVRWVRSQFEEYGQEWSDYIDENPEQEQDINAAIRFVHALHFEEDETIDQGLLWNRISQTVSQESRSIHIENKKSIFANKRFWIPLSVAASILFFFLFRANTSHFIHNNTGIGEQMSVVLPDQSEVKLNAESNIKFSEKEWNSNRKVTLQGEAFFEVAKGEKFVVETPLGTVEVLGTSFNVHQRGEEFVVHCYTGQVAVQMNNNSEKHILSPGEKVVWSEGSSSQKEQFNISTTSEDWRVGVFKFENTPLSKVIEEFERQFKYKIIISPENKKRIYTGFFKTSDLNTALESIVWPMNLKFEIDGKKINID